MLTLYIGSLCVRVFEIVVKDVIFYMLQNCKLAYIFLLNIYCENACLINL